MSRGVPVYFFRCSTGIPVKVTEITFHDGCHATLVVEIPETEAFNTAERPHLPRMIIEIQDQVRRGVGIPFRGETRWNWTVDPRGRFHVTVEYDHEMVALGAIRLAERMINAIDSREIASLDMNREIRRLREIAKLSRRSGPPRREILGESSQREEGAGTDPTPSVNEDD